MFVKYDKSCDPAPVTNPRASSTGRNVPMFLDMILSTSMNGRINSGIGSPLLGNDK